MTLLEGIALVKESLSGIYNHGEADAISQRLFEHYFRINRTTYLLSPTTKLDEQNIPAFRQAIQKLRQHCPIQYVLGETEFYGLSFKLTEAVLIPRPETEELVAWIISDDNGARKSIVDIGTGSGCIAISLAKQLPNTTVTAIDISPAALRVARENAELNTVSIQFIEADIFSSKGITDEEKFDVIVSNPPYICEQEKQYMSANVLSYEPSLALFVPDSDPLRYYHAIDKFANDHLAEGGAIYMEINEALGVETIAVFKEACFCKSELRCDINGKPRMLKVSRM